MSNPDPRPRSPRRFSFRYNLRSLFFVVTLVAAWLGWNVHQLRQRSDLLREIERQGGGAWAESADVDRLDHPFKAPFARREGRFPLAWRLLGARPYSLISLPINFDDDMRLVERFFPEANVCAYIPDDEPLWYPDAERWAELTSRREHFANPEP